MWWTDYNRLSGTSLPFVCKDMKRLNHSTIILTLNRKSYSVLIGCRIPLQTRSRAIDCMKCQTLRKKQWEVPRRSVHRFISCPFLVREWEIILPLNCFLFACNRWPTSRGLSVWTDGSKYFNGWICIRIQSGPFWASFILILPHLFWIFWDANTDGNWEQTQESIVSFCRD